MVRTNHSWINQMFRILCLCAAVAFVTAGVLPTLLENLEEDFRHLEDEEYPGAYRDGDPVAVEVAQGRMIGQVKSYANYSYFSFESIPFAVPPLHERRFKDPEPAGPWEGDLNATLSPPWCPQFLVIGHEDCLYLNVYTPVNSLNGSESLPVMVFIHGGAYYLGSSAAFRGAQPLVQRDVILVTVNYRLGVLGFLSTEDAAAPGNLGLKDQTLALRWVNDNIEAFGGDLERITIFGESAGSASVHYQLLAPSAAGLFSAAIMESGSAFTPWSRGRDFLRVAQQVAERFHCPTERSDDLISCLQKKNHVLLDEMYVEFIDFNFQPFYFAPRIDGEYIPDDPVTLVKEGKYTHVPVMMGINQHEGSLESGEMYWDRFIIDVLVNNFTQNGPASLELYDDEEPLETATKVYDFYLGGLDFSFENADNATRLYSDRLFMIPLDWLTQLTADVDEVYVWELQHRGEHGVMDLLIGLNETLQKRWICHGDEIQYLFQPGIFGKLRTPEDIIVGELYPTMWTNFAKTRNPTPDDSLGFIWEKTNTDDLRHLAITPYLPLSMEMDKRATERAFWETLPLRINKLMS